MHIPLPQKKKNLKSFSYDIASDNKPFVPTKCCWLHEEMNLQITKDPRKLGGKTSYPAKSRANGHWGIASA
jgi:hypothetical protein